MTGKAIQQRAQAFVAAYIAPLLKGAGGAGKLHQELVTGAAMAMLIDCARASHEAVMELHASEELRGQLEAENELLRTENERLRAKVQNADTWLEAVFDFVEDTRRENLRVSA